MKENTKETILKIISVILEFIICFLVAFIITTFFYQPCFVDGSSMYPTLEDKQFGLTSKLALKTKKIERFDIVTIDLNDEERIVKRVIGLPNEKVSCINDVIYIDDLPIDQDFLNEEYVKTYDIFTSDFECYLGDDEYFVLGDNRPRSGDSRVFGPFKFDDFYSIGYFVIYPFKDFGLKK